MKPTVALIYDFDGTLSPRNMQEFGCIQALKKDAASFWSECTRLSLESNADAILCYMWLLLKEAKEEGICLTRAKFREFGSQVELFDGVKDWFQLVNEYGSAKGLNIEHYINSSGLIEMIEGTPIAEEFKQIYACSYLYDESGNAVWPAVAVNFTTKTQFLFKINKGIESISDNTRINEFIEQEKRPVQFKHILYFGDGETDIPCMKLIKEKGGHAIAVHHPEDGKKKRIAEKLIQEGRVNFVCPADYRESKEVFQIVKTILDKIKADFEFSLLLKHHQMKA